MPANLPPQYYAAEKEFREAKNLAEKIEALENMLAIMPKHKGTDHLRADLRARIAKLSEEAERKRGGSRAQLYQVHKEGARQAVLVGRANSGKSQLLAALTEAKPKVAAYPFTTQYPFPAMMPFEDVQIQLVDLPAIDEESARPWLRPILRGADLLLLVVDLSLDPVSDLESILVELAAMRIEPVGDGEEGYTAELAVRKKTLVVANKYDLPEAGENLEILELTHGERLPVVAISAAEGTNVEMLRKAVFDTMDVIRVYTKAPRQKAELSHPIVLKRGSTVEDVAENVHRELRHKLKYAQIWGSGKFSGQKVSRQYVPEDKDVVELYT